MLERAIRLLQAGEPLPVDLIAKLIERGIDVSELETKWSL